MSNPQPSRQRGAASDPRHGKARGEVIEGKPGASAVSQVVMVLIVLASVVGAFLVLGVLLTDDANRSPLITYSVYGLFGVAALLFALALVRRRRSRLSLNEMLSRRKGA